VESYPQNKKSKIAIKPYLDSKVDNMGLQNYGLALFDGVFHEEQISCLEINGIKRYRTGLNEFAPELLDLSPEEKEAKVKQIRMIVSQLERQLNSNMVEPDDKEFWNKIKLLKPDNSEFWDKIKLRCGNEPLFLDPERDPYDLIKLYAIENDGFSMIAKSLQHARSEAPRFKFYLDKFEETASIKTELKKLKNKAFSELQKMFDKNTNKLFYVCKVIDPNSTQYKKSTPLDILYDNMDKYISGETVEVNKRQTAQKFLDICALDMETLKLRAVIKDANFYKLIATRGDGNIYHMKSGSMLGKNPSDILMYLKNPLNEEILLDIITNTEKYWNS
jgi:hypothetical protein